MKIGVIGTIWLNTPPATYGGTEEVVYSLVEELTREGHDVTLFAPATAKVSCKLIPTVEKPLLDSGIGWDDFSYTQAHLKQAFSHADEFDIIHHQLNRMPDFFGLPLALASSTPVVSTLHFESHAFFRKHPKLIKELELYKELPFISISHSQQKGMPVNFIRTVYNSFDVASYPFVKKPEDYFVWIGKIKPEKGTKEAILAAKLANVTLKVLGVIDDAEPTYKEYYEKEIKPELGKNNIEWLGSIGLPEKAEILGNARAFLNPIQWEEPFGMVMVESQATGTPVISFAKGAAREIIKDQITGFLVGTVEEMVERMSHIDELDRMSCRQNVIDNFSIEAMGRGYVAAYQEAIKHWPTLKKM